MIKIICDRCGRETHMKNPDITGRAKIGFEEYDLCKYCILDIKRFINQGRAEQTEPQTDIHDLTDCDFCKERNCKDCEGGKDEPQIFICPIQDDYEALIEDEPQMGDAKPIPLSNRVTHINDEPRTEVVNDSQDLVKDLVKAFGEDGTWLERQGVYTLTLAEAKQRAVDIIESVTAKTEPQTCEDCEHWSDTKDGCADRHGCKTEPQTDCGDFADRLAYERGVKHAWEVAQKVFDSKLTFYEAERYEPKGEE